jgi:phosphoglycerate dehydrogenase-like enzyme
MMQAADRRLECRRRQSVFSWKMPNMLLSPHTADRIEGFLDSAMDCFFDNLDRFRKGDALLNVVDKQAGY